MAGGRQVALYVDGFNRYHGSLKGTPGTAVRFGRRSLSRADE